MKLPSIKTIREQTQTKRWGYERVLDYFANYIVKLALLLKVTPTQLTFFWVIFQFFIPLLFLSGEYRYFVLGIVLFQLMFVLDLSDGKLYRYHHPQRPLRKKLFPKYLDQLGHYVNNPFLFVCLGIGTSLRFGPLYLIFGFAAALFYLLNKAITLNPAWYSKTEEERNKVFELMQQSALRSGSLTGRFNWKQRLFDFFRVEHLGNLLFFGIIFDLPHYTLIAYSLVNFLEFLRKLLSQSLSLLKEDRERN